MEKVMGSHVKGSLRRWQCLTSYRVNILHRTRVLRRLILSFIEDKWTRSAIANVASKSRQHPSCYYLSTPSSGRFSTRSIVNCRASKLPVFLSACPRGDIYNSVWICLFASVSNNCYLLLSSSICRISVQAMLGAMVYRALDVMHSLTCMSMV